MRSYRTPTPELWSLLSEYRLPSRFVLFVAAGLARSAELSWDATVDATIASYRAVLR